MCDCKVCRGDATEPRGHVILSRDKARRYVAGVVCEGCYVAHIPEHSTEDSWQPGPTAVCACCRPSRPIPGELEGQLALSDLEGSFAETRPTGPGGQGRLF